VTFLKTGKSIEKICFWTFPQEGLDARFNLAPFCPSASTKYTLEKRTHIVHDVSMSGALRLNNAFVLITCHTACFPRCEPRCWRTTWSSSLTRTGQWPVSWWLLSSFHLTRTPISKRVWWNRTTSWTVKSVWNDKNMYKLLWPPCCCDCSRNTV